MKKQKKQIRKQKSFHDVCRPSTKIVLIISAVIVATLATLLTIAAFFDLKISEILAQPFLPKIDDVDKRTIDLADGGATTLIGQVYTNSIFGKIIEIIGTAPCIIVTVASLAIFYWNADAIKNNHLRRFTKTGMVTLSIGWNIYACFFQFFPLFAVSLVGVDGYAGFGPLSGTGAIANAYTCALFIVFGAVFGGLMTYGMFIMFKQIKQPMMKELLRYAFIVSSASLASILLIEVALKPTLQRERYRFIYAFSQIDKVLGTGWGYDPSGAEYSSDPRTYGGFHPWYALPIAPNAFKEGNLPFISEDISKSFPSGHETMASVGFYSLIILPLTVRELNTKKAKAICFSLAVIGSGVVGFGRVLAGAHYLSDVTMGSFIAIGFLIIFYLSNVYGSKFLNKWTGLTIYQPSKR